MKKFVCMAMTAALLMSLCACGGGDNSTNTSTSGSQDGGDAQKTYDLQLANNLPTTHVYNIAFEELANTLKEKSNGQINLKLYPAEQLGVEKEYVDQVFAQTLDFGTSGPSEIANRYKPAMVFDAPYLFDSWEQMLEFTNGEASQFIWDDLKEKFNVEALVHLYYGTREITANKEIHTPADMAGMKFRVPNGPMQLAYGKAFGANPTPTALGEVYLGLQQGVVDGQENPLVTIDTYKFNEVCDYLVMSDHIVALVSVYASGERLAALPEDIQTIIRDEFKAIADPTSQAIADAEAELVSKFEEGGMTVIEPDKEAFKEACAPIYTEFESEWGEGLVEKIQSAT
ncbi:MAG: sialic acid TRAP transporter substrate-binding protein SiaP [Eubacteriales bacterium]|jgi:tripartite ATP-independent transporter DctP family solute receptor